MTSCKRHYYCIAANHMADIIEENKELISELGGKLDPGAVCYGHLVKKCLDKYKEDFVSDFRSIVSGIVSKQCKLDRAHIKGFNDVYSRKIILTFKSISCLIFQTETHHDTICDASKK